MTLGIVCMCFDSGWGFSEVGEMCCVEDSFTFSLKPNSLSSSKCPKHQIHKAPIHITVQNAKKIQCIGKASIVNNTLLVEIWNQV